MANHRNNDKSLVSIITVVFNGKQHLEQTIKSVLCQTYKNIEYIVIDGGSTDGTLDIIKKYNDKIAYWISEPDKGIYDAMNKGLKHANGELIGMVNSDDWYEPDAIETIVDAYRKYPKGGVYYGLLKVWDGDDVLSISGNTHHLLDTKMLAHPTCFIKKGVYKEFGYFDSKYRIAGDYELMLRLRKNQVTFCFIEKIITNFRLGGVSVTNERSRVFEKLEIQKRYGLIKTSYFVLKKLLTIIQEILAKRVIS